MKRPPLRSFHVENFKAIRDSQRVEFGWLTVFIGNNGAGKSSLIEALETFRDVVLDGADSAFRRWRGFEHALNKSPARKLLKRNGHRSGYSGPMKFDLEWVRPMRSLRLSQSITQGIGGNALFIQREQIVQERKDRTERWTRNGRGKVLYQGERPAQAEPDGIEVSSLADGESMLKRFAPELFDRCQFLMLNPDRMGQPTPQQRATRGILLAKDGSNVAELLQYPPAEA